MGNKTIIPAIPSPKLDVVKSAQTMKEIHEVREGRRGDPLDRFVSVRDMLTDDDILQRLDARYYTEAEISLIGADYLLHDGTRALTGDWNAGAFTISMKSAKLDDTDASNHLELKWNEDAAADYVLNFLVGAGDRSVTLSGDLTVEAASLINQDLTTDASATLANLGLGTGELTAGSINRAAGSLTLEIGGAAQATIATTGVTITPTLILSTCIDAGADVDKFLVLDAANNVDYRTGAQVLSDINAASVVTFAAVNAALAAANADINVNAQDIENISQLAIGFTSPTYELEARIADDHLVWANRVYSDTTNHRPYLYFTKSHTDTEWNIVETVNGDELGEISFLGVTTGSAFGEGAVITAQQNAASGGNVPTDLIFRLSSDAASRTVLTMDYTEITLGTGINFQQANADETHYLGRCALGWLGSGNEAGLQHRSLDIDGTNYAIQQLNLGATYLNCSSGKNIYFQEAGVTVTNLSELDDLTDGGETTLHTHPADDPVSFTAVNAALAAADATIDINGQDLSSVGTIGCGTITTTGNLVLPANGVIGVTDGNPQILFDNANNWLEITGAVGIGTPVPTSTALGVYRAPSAAAGDVAISLEQGLAGGALWGFRLAATSYDFNIDRKTGGNWQTPALTIDRGTGNVGIGTVTPNTKLEIAAVTPYLRLTDTRNGVWSSGDIFSGIQFYTSDVTGNCPMATAAIEAILTEGYSGIGAPRTDLRFLTWKYDDATATERLRITELGKVGIGTATPGEKLDVQGGQFYLSHTTGNPIIRLASNSLFSYNYSNTYYDTGSKYSINGGANEIRFGIGTDPGCIRFATAPTGTAGNAVTLTARMQLSQAGLLGIGGTAITTPLAQLHVDQATDDAAIPVLILDQADADEPFMKFIGTSESEVLTNSLVSGLDVGGGTVAGYIKVFVQDDGDQLTDQAYYIALRTINA